MSTRWLVNSGPNTATQSAGSSVLGPILAELAIMCSVVRVPGTWFRADDYGSTGGHSR